MNLPMMNNIWLDDSAVRYEDYHLAFDSFAQAMMTTRIRSSEWTKFKSEKDLQFVIRNVVYEEYSLVWHEDNICMMFVCL